MLTFKQFINENLESYLKRYPPFDSQLDFDSNYVKSYTFDTDSGISYEVIFYNKVSDYLTYWIIAFERTSPGAGDDYSKTGYGIIPINDQVESIRIFTTVIKIIIEQDKKFTGDFVYRMSANLEEKSRIKLYDTFLPMLANEMNRVCYKYVFDAVIYNLIKKEKETEWLNSMTNSVTKLK